jgi:hypothetical protein
MLVRALLITAISGALVARSHANDVTATRASAAETPTSPATLATQPADDSTPSPPPVVDWGTRLDANHEQVSLGLETMARKLDAFFGDDRAFEDANKTYVRLRSDALFEENQTVSFDVNLNAKVNLPRTEHRLQLLIQSEDDDVDEQAPSPPDPVAAAERKSVGIAVEGRIPHMGRWNVKPAAGIWLRWPPDPYAQLRAVRYVDLEPWLARISATTDWFLSEGVSVRGRLDFDRALSPAYLFRVRSNLEWKERKETIKAQQSLTLFQRLSERHQLQYVAGVNAKSDQAWGLEDYFIRGGYRARLHQKWLFAEIQPQVTFPRDEDFNDIWSIMLRLEANFGAGYRTSRKDGQLPPLPES